MAKNVAAAQHAKALRRRAVVAGKKKAEMQASSLAGQVAVAAALPIQHCLVTKDWEEVGMAQIWLTRGATPHHLLMGAFLLDTLHRGVKDSFLREMPGAEFTKMHEVIQKAVPMEPIEPAKARRLLRDLVAWARGQGVSPHEDYPTMLRMFADVDPNASDAVFTFGASGLAEIDADDDDDHEGPIVAGPVIAGPIIDRQALTAPRPHANPDRPSRRSNP